MIHWWERIDRQDEVAHALNVARNGGRLVLAGSDAKGVSQTLKLIQEALTLQRIEYVLAEVNTIAPTKKSHLLSLWKAVRPKDPGSSSIPRWAAFSNADPGTVVDEMVADLTSVPPRAAVAIFPFIDRFRSIEQWEASRLLRLSNETGLGLIVAAKAEEPWSTLGSCTTFRLKNFFRSDIVECLANRTDGEWLSSSEQARLVDLVVSAADNVGSINPMDAYSILAAEAAL